MKTQKVKTKDQKRKKKRSKTERKKERNCDDENKSSVSFEWSWFFCAVLVLSGLSSIILKCRLPMRAGSCINHIIYDQLNICMLPVFHFLFPFCLSFFAFIWFFSRMQCMYLLRCFALEIFSSANRVERSVWFTICLGLS